MSRKRYKLALAGLLHDVGKFAQRVDVGITRTWDDEAERDYKYKHALMTHDFVKKYGPENVQDIHHWAGNHHAPTSNEERIIRLADQLSSGERLKETHPDDDTRKRHPKQLRSIFSSLVVDGETTPEKEIYYPLQELALEKNVIFPGQKEKSGQVWKAYDKVWKKFLPAVKGLKSMQDLPTYLENLLELMKRYTWNIPSAYWNAIPDISLYDHNRMTAALAVCLEDLPEGKVEAIQTARDAKYAEQKLSAKQKKLLQEESVALLVGGDISGVQDFIYSITSKRAAKTLRGRSFYLQLLTEAILRYTLAQLDLPYTNVIYAGGGHFFLLAPPSAADQLPALQRAITQKMLHYHGTRLYFALGSTQVPADGFNKGKFPAYWTQMHSNITKAKRQRYTELGDDLYNQVFELDQHGGNTKNTCSICGEERFGTETIKDKNEENDSEKTRHCPMCASFGMEIGKELPDSKFVVLGLKEPTALPDPHSKTREDAYNVLATFGVEVGWSRSMGKLKAESPILSEDVDRAIVWALDDVEEYPQRDDGIPTVQATHYTVNLVPQKKDGAIKTFEDIIDDKENGAKGIPRLGVLRMDVDGLGNIFKNGFKDEKGTNSATLSRLSALSFQMSTFFEGWIKKICEQEDYKNSIYAVYAGGDDVFLLGPWQKMPKLARTITNDLNEYTGGHPGIHLSGGMTFIHGKYPIYQAADDAGEAESKAKKHGQTATSPPTKNAFHFLGRTYSWSAFEALTEKYEHIIALVGDPDNGLDLEKETDKKLLGGPSALIQILRNVAEEKAKHQADDERLKWGPWIWHGYYRLRKMAKRYENKNPELSDGVKEIQEIFDDEGSKEINTIIDDWSIAARWAQLRSRKTKNSEEE